MFRGTHYIREKAKIVHINIIFNKRNPCRAKSNTVETKYKQVIAPKNKQETISSIINRTFTFLNSCQSVKSLLPRPQHVTYHLLIKGHFTKIRSFRGLYKHYRNKDQMWDHIKAVSVTSQKSKTTKFHKLSVNDVTKQTGRKHCILTNRYRTVNDVTYLTGAKWFKLNMYLTSIFSLAFRASQYRD